MAEVEVALYFIDNVSKVILSQETITKKGMDSTEDKAVEKAIKQIQARDPKLKKLIKIGKDRAIQYYKATEETEETAEDTDVSWIFNQ